MSSWSRWSSVLLLMVILKQAWFVTSIPAWQVPDEPAHVSYVQAIVEERTLPVFSDTGMDVSGEMLNSLTAIEDSNSHRIGRHYPPGFLSVPTGDDRSLVVADAPVRNLAARNSPVYYLYEALPYVVFQFASIETRLMGMRAVSAVLLVVTVWLAMKIAARFSTRLSFRLAVGAVVGFHPAATLLFAGVNPDAALTVISTLAIWLMLRPLNTQSPWRQTVWLAGCIGFAASIKSPGWFLLGPALMWWFSIRTSLVRRTWVAIGASAAAISLFLGGAWLVMQRLLSSTSVIDFTGVERHPLTWQRILNNDLFERPAIVFRTWWGHIGWSGVSRYNEEWVYGILVLLSVLMLIGVVFALWRRSWRIPKNTWLLIVGAVSLEGLYQAMYWRAGLMTGASHFPIHGRYYLPVVVPLAMLLVFGVGALFPKNFRWIGYVVTVGIVLTSTFVIGFSVHSLYVAERAAGW